jgi:hypothetical protein
MNYKVIFMRRNIAVTFFLINSIFMAYTIAAEKLKLPEGKIESPFKACKGILVVSQGKYQQYKANWDQIEKDCHTKLQVSQEIGYTSIDPLKEGVQYLTFAQKIAQKVVENLKKNRQYSQCSASCFSGKSVCPAVGEQKEVQCSDRKKEIQEGMKVFSRKIRMELALSNENSGLINLNIRNVLNVDKDKFINKKLLSFEMITPNPVGNTELSEREFKEAMNRSNRDRQDLEKEFKQNGYTNYSDWMSIKLMEKFEDHRARYRSLIYEEAPLFSVIEKADKIENGADPVWSDAKMAKAFSKLAENTVITETKVKQSIDKSILEFKRNTPEALTNFITTQKDLLYYIGMKNQVEEELKKDPTNCGIATSMAKRLDTKEKQNIGITMAASLAIGPMGGFALRLGTALTAAEAAGVTGLVLGAGFLEDSYKSYSLVKTEAATVSGLGGNNESPSLRKSEEVTVARDGVKFSLAFAPIGTTGAWGLGKTLYSSLAKQMARDLPEMNALSKAAKLNLASRDRIVDKWLLLKIKSAIKNDLLNEGDDIALQSEKGKNVLESLTAEIEKSNPAFFKNPKNIDFFLKTAATAVRKVKGDPADLGEKAKELLLHFNTEAMDGTWNPKEQAGLLKVFNNAIEELRLSASNDPATYAKFSTEKAAQEKILEKALKRSGAEDRDLKSMVQCAVSF